MASKLIMISDWLKYQIKRSPIIYLKSDMAGMFPHKMFVYVALKSKMPPWQDIFFFKTIWEN